MKMFMFEFKLSNTQLGSIKTMLVFGGRSSEHPEALSMLTSALHCSIPIDELDAATEGHLQSCSAHSDIRYTKLMVRLTISFVTPGSISARSTA